VVEKAKKAQNEWGSLTFKARSQVLYKYRELLVKYREEISEINSVENGKNMAEAYAGVDKAIELTDFACSMPQLISEKTEEVSRGVVCKEIRKPLGVVASITPFNFPVMVPNWTIPNSIVLGNAIILKPSELTPISAMKMAELWKEAGLPDGIFNVVNGGKEIVERICDQENIAAVSFVGSTPVAKIVHERCSKNGKRVLALGGAKNHITVMPDVNVEAGSRDIIASAFGMSGQRCMAASVIIGVGNVQEILNSVVEKAKEMKAGEDLPPLVTKVAVQKIIDYIEFAEKNGGKILVDGREKMSSENSCLIGPTIIEWSESSNMGKTEVFGPLLEFVKADSLEEAIKIQNRSPYGNAASIFTQNGRIADEAIKGFQAGMLGINIGVPVPREPFSFGGIKDSKFGYGDITGESSINFWTNLIKLTTKWNAENKVDWMS
jgi:malonate-semialdehyde dehydrogenase (acetylating)/methylmalonate-semialdehyde dehydrogenase